MAQMWGLRPGAKRSLCLYMEKFLKRNGSITEDAYGAPEPSWSAHFEDCLRAAEEWLDRYQQRPEVVMVLLPHHGMTAKLLEKVLRSSGSPEFRLQSVNGSDVEEEDEELDEEGFPLVRRCVDDDVNEELEPDGDEEDGYGCGTRGDWEVVLLRSSSAAARRRRAPRP